MWNYCQKALSSFFETIDKCFFFPQHCLLWFEWFFGSSAPFFFMVLDFLLCQGHKFCCCPKSDIMIWSKGRNRVSIFSCCKWVWSLISTLSWHKNAHSNHCKWLFSSNIVNFHLLIYMKMLFWLCTF
jgi:hypothetical protein